MRRDPNQATTEAGLCVARESHVRFLSPKVSHNDNNNTSTPAETETETETDTTARRAQIIEKSVYCDRSSIIRAQLLLRGRINQLDQRVGKTAGVLTAAQKNDRILHRHLCSERQTR